MNKKEAKFRLKALKKGGKVFRDGESDVKSKGVRFAESTRGVLYIVLGFSLIFALVMSNNGYIITLEDIFGSFRGAFLGNIIIVLIGVAFLIYGLKHIGLVR